MSMYIGACGTRYHTRSNPPVDDRINPARTSLPGAGGPLILSLTSTEDGLAILFKSLAEEYREAY